MSKKIKPVAINDVEITESTNIAEVKSDIIQSMPTQKAVLDRQLTPADVLDAKPSADDRIAGLEKVNAELIAENESLKTEIEKYIVELSELRNASSGECPTSNDTSAELEELRSENDSYLIKISELTFENAKLKSQLTSTGSKHASLPASHGTIKNSLAFGPAKLNGYSSWN